jgi:hypothetical protein
MPKVSEQLQQAGINLDTLKKGDLYTKDQVEMALRLMDEKIDENIARFHRGELGADPMSFACQRVIALIDTEMHDRKRPVVCRAKGGGIQVLTDAEAMIYVNAQANAGLRKHEKQTRRMFTAIDPNQLSDHQRRQLESNQSRHAFVMAAHKGARTESLRMQRKGLQLPKYGETSNS